MSPDLEYQKYATPTQWKYYLAVCQFGSGRAAAKALGVNKSTVTNAIQRMKIVAATRSGYAPDHGLYEEAPPGFAIGKVTQHWDYRKPEGEQLVEVWPRIQPIDDELTLLRDAVDEAFNKYEGKFKPKKTPKQSNSKFCSTYNVGDPHIGLYSTASEVGEGNDYNVDIATQDHINACRLLVGNAPASEVGMIVDVGDYFNSPDQSNRTLSGHSLDSDGRLSRTFEKGFTCILALINIGLLKHKEIVLFIVPGNHDSVLSMCLRVAVKQAFIKEPRVTILNNANPYLYYEWKNNLFGATHGDRTKPAALPEIMAADMPEAWGRCKHRVFFSGHRHHKEIKEFRGCNVETFPSLAAASYYLHHAGYRAGRSMCRVDYHAEYGEGTRETMPLEMVRDLMGENI